MSKSPSKTKWPLLSAADLALFAGITVRHFNRLVKERHVPRGKNGRYVAEVAIPALVAYYRQGAQGSSDLAAEKLKHTVAQRREIEQRTAKRARDLIAVSEVRTAFDTAMTLIGAQLDGLSGRLANDVAAQSDPAICKQVIFNETRRIRAAAAAELKAFADPTGGSNAASTAEGHHRG